MKRTNSGRMLFVVLVASVFVMLFVSSGAQAAPAAAHIWVGNRVSDFDAWQPSPAGYTNGNPTGYSEGDTAAFRLTVQGDSDGQQLKVIVCLDYDNSGAYAFTDVESWDTSETPGNPPVPPPLTGEVSGFNAANATIDTITALGEGGGSDGQSCPANFLGWLVEFTIDWPTAASALSYIVYGGHIAKEGDPLPGGGTVGAGESASNTTGNFQAQLESENLGQRSINFQSQDILPPTAITLAQFGADGGDLTKMVIVPAGLLLLISAVLLLGWFKRRSEIA